MVILELSNFRSELKSEMKIGLQITFNGFRDLLCAGFKRVVGPSRRCIVASSDMLAVIMMPASLISVLKEPTREYDLRC